MGRRTAAGIVGGVLAVGLLAACGGDEPTDTQPTEPPAAEETTGDAAPPEETTDTGDDMTGAPVVAVADSELGQILVDGEGMTLYLFTQDSPGTSACLDQCLEAWPVLEGEPTAGEGVEESLLGSFAREDGTVQATYADWPLYYFAQDTEPGDVTGQGVNDVWYVLSPDGEMVTEAPADTGARAGY